MNNDKKQVVKGIFWTGLQTAVNQGFAFLVRLVLASILFPEEFGLVGMATVFTGFVQVLNDLGIGAALVQRKEDQLTPAHYHTAFWTGIGWSAGLYLIISFGVAPLAAIFYDEPILRLLVPVLSLGILSSPVNLVNKAQLIKRMDFRKIAFIDNTANVIAGLVALGLAFWGAGVWSLAFNSVASIVVAIPLYFRSTGWTPKLIWDRKAFQDIFGFGVYTTGTNVANYLINNIDYLLIGKLLNAASLGIYTLAFTLTDTFRSRLMAVINNVMYPMYGKKQDDPSALKRYYLKVVHYNSIVIYPIMVALITFSEPVISLCFGEKWDTAVVPLKIMALAVMFHMLVNSNTALIRGMGRPDLEMKLQLIKSLIFVPTLAVGIHYYGIEGAATAVLINKILAVLIAQFTFNRLLHMRITTIEFIRVVKAPWIASAVAFLTGHLLFGRLDVHFTGALAAQVVAYGTTIWLLMGKELKMQVTQLRLAKAKHI